MTANHAAEKTNNTAIQRVQSTGRNAGGAVLDLLFPPRCLGCGDPVAQNGQLCATCWTAINFLGEPCCHCCGYPFDVPVDAGTLCGACVARPPLFDQARALMKYDEGARHIILGFKHADRLQLAPAMAKWMVGAYGDMIRRADALVPVPLHRWRLFRRRYNQSALLAREICKLADKAFLYDGLIRQRPTPPQQGLTRKQRHDNVRGAFVVHDKRRRDIENRRLLLIDDVMTTGATIEACAKTLCNAGASRVDILTIARVVRPETDII